MSTNNKNPCASVFLDITKAFDTIDHSILLNKLEIFGFRGQFEKLIQSYLNNREQYVFFQSKTSDIKNIKNGVPQGSVLSPLLFLIFVNDLPTNMQKSEITLFAGDTNILFGEKNFEKNKKESITEAILWFKENKLCVNFKKSELMYFGKDLGLNMNPILPDCELQESVKCLGITVDRKLNFDFHNH